MKSVNTAPFSANAEEGAKKIYFRFFVLLLAFCLVLPLSSCAGLAGRSERYTAYTLDYFDTVITLIGYAPNENSFNEIKNEVFAQFAEYHALFSIYDEVNGVNNLKKLNDERSIQADPRLVDFLCYGKEIYQKTNGRTNIAMGAVLSLWHEARELGTQYPERAVLPDEDKLREAAEHCDINSLVIDEATNTVTLADSRTLIDVGAVGKGYAVEMIAKHLEAKGVSGYLINAGGNVRAIGLRSDGTPWRVGVENPDPDSYRNGESFLAELSLEKGALVTSGSYQRYFYVNGKAYHHIISPDTLMPSEGIVSLSVLADNSAEADALSTALFTLSYEEGVKLLEKYECVHVLWLLENGEIRTTDGFPDTTNNNE